MPEKKQINVRVSPEKKIEWREYVDENPETDSLTQLVRLAVTQYINDDSGVVPDRDGGSVSVDTSEIEQSLTRLENKMDTLTDDVGVVKREVTGPRAVVPSLYADPDDVFEALPSGDGPEDGITPQELEKKFPDVDGVADVADRLEREMSVVKKTMPTMSDEPDRRYYWKEDK